LSKPRFAILTAIFMSLSSYYAILKSNFSHWTRVVASQTFHMMKETDIVSETLCSLNNRRWTTFMRLSDLMYKFKQSCLCVYISIYLSVYVSMALQSFCWTLVVSLVLYTVGRFPWTGYQPVAKPLPTRRTTQTQNKRRYPCLEWDSNLRSQR
jgi:hypothetical protein